MTETADQQLAAGQCYRLRCGEDTRVEHDAVRTGLSIGVQDRFGAKTLSPHPRCC